MLNAHLRFGWLNFIKVTDRKTTSFRVRLDRFIAEPPQNRSQSARAHLISVIGGDTQLAAISAGLSESGHFSVEGPGIEPVRVWLGETKPHTYRATLSLPGRRRPVRHLISLSQDIAGGTSADKIVLIDSNPAFVLQAVARIFGLPGLPEWASWFYEQLEWRNAITPLLGVGCSPILIKGSREEFLSWMGTGVRSGALILPKQNRAIKWPSFGLEEILVYLDRDTKTVGVT